MATQEHSQLAYLGFQRITPSIALAPYVECFWYIQRSCPIPQPHDEFLHPQGGSGLIFNLGDTLYFDGNPSRHNSLLDGTNVRSRRLCLQGKIKAFGVRFRPGGMFPLFSIPQNLLSNSNLDLHSLSISKVQEVEQQLFASSTVSEGIYHLENWLIKCVDNLRPGATTLGNALQLVEQHRGSIGIRQLESTTNLGQRQLERLFKMQVGMSPKTYARLLRVAHARKRLSGTDEKIAEIGLAAGFFDQSHFTRDFKAVVGLAPFAYREHRREKRRYIDRNFFNKRKLDQL